MKKIIIGIFIGLCVALIIASLFIMFYLKKSENKDMLNTQNIDVSNTENITTSNIENTDISDIENGEQDNSERFLGKTSKEWEEKIKQYHTLNNLDSFEKIECHYDEDKNFRITVSTQYEVCAEYVFDRETEYATEIFSKDIIDFENMKVLERRTKTKIDFKDYFTLAIGYVSDSNVSSFADKNFYDNDYNSLPVYDFRDVDKRKDGYGYRFVLIPKSDAAKVSIYNCHIGENGILETDNVLIENIDKPFIIYADYVETTPRICVHINYNTVHTLFPIIFDGISGKLDIEDEDILDVSIY